MLGSSVCMLGNFHTPKSVGRICVLGNFHTPKSVGRICVLGNFHTPKSVGRICVLGNFHTPKSVHMLCIDQVKFFMQVYTGSYRAKKKGKPLSLRRGLSSKLKRMSTTLKIVHQMHQSLLRSSTKCGRTNHCLAKSSPRRSR